MLHYIIPGCVDISANPDLSEDIKNVVERSTKIRDETLTRCYNIQGYDAMSRDDKIKIYDKIHEEVEAELTNTL